MLRETTSRGLCELLRSLRTNERGNWSWGSTAPECNGPLERCVFITAVPITKLFARGGGGDGGHVLRETTSRGRCELVCPSRTNFSERGGEGYCVKEEGEGEEGERERERAVEVRLYYSLGY